MKPLLCCSFALNILLIGFFAGKRLYYQQSGKAQPTELSFADKWNDGRLSVLHALPIDTSDIVFIGDSQTEGFLVNEVFGLRVRNRGISSNTTDHVLSRIDDILKNHPKRIIVAIGINDLQAGRPVNEVIENIARIMTKTRSLSPHTDVVFNAVFPTRGDYQKLMPEINTFNVQLRQFCHREKIAFVDTYSPLLKGDQLDKSYTYDNLHLNGKGYAVWASVISPYTH